MSRTIMLQIYHVFITLFALVPGIAFAGQATDDPCVNFFMNSKNKTMSKSMPLMLSRSASDALVKTRVCIKSYPWPSELTGGKGSKAFATLTSSEMRSIRTKVNKTLSSTYKPKTKGEIEDQLVRDLRKAMGEKPDAEQIRLYGDFLYLFKLNKEGKFQQIANEVAKIKKQRNIVPQSVVPTNVDQATYFSTTILKNLIVAYDITARASLGKQSVAKALDAVVEYLDNRNALDASMELVAFKPPYYLINDGVRSVLSTMQLPDWRRMSVLDRIPSLAGVQNGRDGVVVYLRGKNVHALDIDEYGKVSLLSARDAANRFRTFCRSEILTKSTEQMRLFSVVRWGKAYEIEIGDRRFNVTEDEYSQLKKGIQLSPSHPLSKALNAASDASRVLYSNPFMNKHGKALTEADNFAFALAKSYTKLRIYRDPLSAETGKRVATLNQFNIQGASDTVAIVEDDSFKNFNITDYRIIQNVRKELNDAGIKIVSYRPGTAVHWTDGSGKTLIVITGHSDKALAEMVRSLGSEGVFKDNYVLFNSCKTRLSRDLVSEINTRFGASATFTHDRTIEASEVEGFMIDLASKTKQGPVNFHEILMDALHKNKLNGIWTVCQVLIRRRIQHG